MKMKYPIVVVVAALFGLNAAGLAPVSGGTAVVDASAAPVHFFDKTSGMVAGDIVGEIILDFTVTNTSAHAWGEYRFEFFDSTFSAPRTDILVGPVQAKVDVIPSPAHGPDGFRTGESRRQRCAILRRPAHPRRNHADSAGRRRRSRRHVWCAPRTPGRWRWSSRWPRWRFPVAWSRSSRSGARTRTS